MCLRVFENSHGQVQPDMSPHSLATRKTTMTISAAKPTWSHLFASPASRSPPASTAVSQQCSTDDAPCRAVIDKACRSPLDKAKSPPIETPKKPTQSSTEMRRPQSENAVAVKPLWSHLFAAPNSNKTRLAQSFRAEKVTCPSRSDVDSTPRTIDSAEWSLVRGQLAEADEAAETDSSSASDKGFCMSVTGLSRADTESSAPETELSTSETESSELEVETFTSKLQGYRRELVDDHDSLRRLLDSMSSLPTAMPCIYLDVEGRQLGSFGVACLLTLHIRPQATTYVIDIVALGDAAFMTPGCESSWTMQSVLESTAVPKVVFDIRSQSNALFTLFGVRLGNIHEIQLMEVACRPTSRVYVSGLVKCVWTCPGLDDADKQHWVSRKAHYRELCNPAYGGDDALLERRPIEPAVVNMCATNIESLPILWDTYKAQNGGLSMKRILTATRERIAASQASDYKTQGKHMTFAPPSLQVRRASFGRYR